MVGECEAEVDEDRVAVGVDDDVGGFEVAVDDAVLVELLGAACETGEESDAVGRGEEAGFAPGVEVQALHVLGGDVEAAVGGDAIVDEAWKALEVELFEGVEFEPGKAGGGADEFECESAVGAVLAGEVDDAPAAAANFAFEREAGRKRG